MRAHARWLAMSLAVGLAVAWLVVPAKSATAATPTLSIGSTKVVESPTGSTTAYFTVTLSAPQASTVTFQWHTVDGTATAGVDYKAATGVGSIPNGQITTKIAIKILSDVGKDTAPGTSKEAFSVTISNAVGATIVTSSGTCQILEYPQVSIGDASIVEPLVQTSGAKSKMTFTLTLSPAQTRTVTVTYKTVDGTAVAGEDYRSVNSSVTFAAGASTVKIAVLIKADTGTSDVPGEGNERFSVVITGTPSNIFVGRGTGKGTIIEQDPPGSPQSVMANAGPGVGQVSLAWSPPASDGGVAISSYSYEVSTDGGTTFGAPINVGMATSAVDSCGSPAVTCTYEVFATNAVGNGAPSGPVSATTFGPPGAPQDLAATPDTPGSGNVDLSWSAPLSDGGTAVTEYDYAVSTDGGATFGPQINVGTATSAIDPCGTGNSCSYEVFATNIVGQGPASAIASTTGP